jgi:hypothetical protein
MAVKRQRGLGRLRAELGVDTVELGGVVLVGVVVADRCVGGIR